MKHARLLPALCLVLFACGDSDDMQAVQDAGLSVDASPSDGGLPSDTGIDASVPPEDSGVTVDAGPPLPAESVGTQCTPDPVFVAGDCPDERFFCIDFPKGYCTASCNFGLDCGADNRCVETAQAGELCMPSCSSDADCRMSEGYACDPSWGVCGFAPFPLAPVLSTCPPASPRSRSAFAAPTQLSSSAGPGRYNLEPAAALAANGDVVAVYMARGGLLDSGASAVSTLSPDGTVEADRPFTSDRSNHFDVWMASDRNHQMYQVWLGHNGGRPENDMEIGFSTSTDGQSWTAPVSVHDPNDCAFSAPGCLDKPMIAVGPDPSMPSRDNVYVFYSSTGRGLKMVRSIDGGDTFSNSVYVGPGTYADAEVASDGSIHVVYVAGSALANRFGDVQTKIEYVRSTDGGVTFSPPVVVSAAGESIPFYFSNPQVAFDPARDATYVVYPQGPPSGEWDIQLATATATTTFVRTKLNDDASCANHRIPTIALDPSNGALHIAWVENRNGAGQLVYTQCDAAGASCTPNEAVSDDFAAYSLTRHSPKWVGEYFWMIVDDPGRELHLVWTQPVMEDGIAISRIFHSKRSL